MKIKLRIETEIVNKTASRNGDIKILKQKGKKSDGKDRPPYISFTYIRKIRGPRIGPWGTHTLIFRDAKIDYLYYLKMFYILDTIGTTLYNF